MAESLLHVVGLHEPPRKTGRRRRRVGRMDSKFKTRIIIECMKRFFLHVQVHKLCMTQQTKYLPSYWQRCWDAWYLWDVAGFPWTLVWLAGCTTSCDCLTRSECISVEKTQNSPHVRVDGDSAASELGRCLWADCRICLTGGGRKKEGRRERREEGRRRAGKGRRRYEERRREGEKGGERWKERRR